MVVRRVAVLLAVAVVGAQGGAGGQSCGWCNPGGGCGGAQRRGWKVHHFHVLQL